MIKEFERALATGQSLDTVRYHLKSKADGIRLAQYAEIDRAYNSCQLILFGITEPAGSVAGSIARGYVKKCKKEYYATKEGKEHRKLIRDLMKAEKDDAGEPNKTKGMKTNDADQKEQAQPAGQEQHDK